jgi:hypothetical protein
LTDNVLEGVLQLEGEERVKWDRGGRTKGLELTGRGDHDNFGFDSSGANSWSGPRVIGV